MNFSLQDFLLITVFAYPLMQAWGTALVALFWVAGRAFSHRLGSLLFIVGVLIGSGLLFWGWHQLPIALKTWLDLAYTTFIFLVSVGLLLTVLPRFVAVRRKRGQVVAGATRPVIWTRLIALSGLLFFISGMVLTDHILTAEAPDSWNAALTTFALFLQANVLYMVSLIFMRQVSWRGVLVRLTFFPWSVLGNLRGTKAEILVDPAGTITRWKTIRLHIRPADQGRVAQLLQERLETNIRNKQ